MNYPICPICNSEWEVSVETEVGYISPFNRSCKNCHIIYYKDIMLCRNDILNVGDQLAWRINKHNCIYWIPGPKNSILLPWLPIDINTDKLKLYLLFS